MISPAEIRSAYAIIAPHKAPTLTATLKAGRPADAEAGGAATLAALSSRQYVPDVKERVGVLTCGGNTVAVNFKPH